MFDDGVWPKKLTPELVEAIDYQLSVMDQANQDALISKIHHMAFVRLVASCKSKLERTYDAGWIRGDVIEELLRQFDHCRYDLRKLTLESTDLRVPDWYHRWRDKSSGFTRVDAPDHYKRWKKDWYAPMEFIRKYVGS